jgi:hypothetical protein
MTIRYDDANMADMSEALLALYYWHDKAGYWITLPTVVDPDTNTLTVLLDHLTVFAVLEDPNTRVYAPLLRLRRPPPALAQVVAMHSGKCLDVAGGTHVIEPGATVIQWECTGAANQIWRLAPVGDVYQVIATHSNQCLDVQGGVDATAKGIDVVQWECTGAANQLWRLVPRNGAYQLVAVHSGKCLDVEGGESAIENGTPVIQWDCTGESNQLWQIVPQ